MMRLSEAIARQKCRKGRATGTTENGCYWLCAEPVMLDWYGPCGIGPCGMWWLELRHFRCGEVRPTLCREMYGAVEMPQLAELSSIEDIIVALKEEIARLTGAEKYYSFKISDSLAVTIGLNHMNVAAALKSIGMNYHDAPGSCRRKT